MAGCYHDNRDFKSDLNIEVAGEDDILEVGQDLKDIKCDKNPGHRDFIPFKDLALNHLPEEDRKIEILDEIKNAGKIVVRLVVGEKIGSGYVYKIKGKYYIRTNNHVVETDDEVRSCTVQFHYDDYKTSSVLTCKGVELLVTCPYIDVSFFTFHPIPQFVHQLRWDDDLIYPPLVIMYKNYHIETEITSSHSRSKISFHHKENLNSSQIYMMFISHLDGSYSYLKSHLFKFEPIPSNIQQLNQIPIRIVEDDGNSRVIPGDVVKFGNEFVVKISECIFQDEVKKCRLVLNGKVIGRGTRLYFTPINVRRLQSGIELEHSIKGGHTHVWVFNLHPIPSYLDDRQLKPSNYMYCIGHPHGSIKMVTIGRFLKYSMERFDNKNRHIKESEPNCKCKEVNCLKYTCKTCPGSSGSPVFRSAVEKGVPIIRPFSSHFMGEKRGEFENINTAWAPTKYNQLE